MHSHWGASDDADSPEGDTWPEGLSGVDSTDDDSTAALHSDDEGAETKTCTPARRR